MMVLQQEMRRMIQRIKGKAQAPLMSEMIILVPINPHNRPIQSSSTRADQRKDFSKLKDIAKHHLSPDLNKVKSLVCKPFDEIAMASFEQAPRNFEALMKNKEGPIRAFKQIKGSSNKAKINDLEQIKNKTNEVFFVNTIDKPQVFINELGFDMQDATKKSPLLEESFIENKGEIEQNTIIKVKLENYEQIPEANLSKEQDDILDKMSLLGDKTRQNFMSFKEFADVSNQKSDDTKLKDEMPNIFDKMKKLSFKEEDYFDKSMRIDHKVEDDEENCFELLNERYNFATNAEKFNKEIPDTEEKQAKCQDFHDNYQEFQKENQDFNDDKYDKYEDIKENIKDQRQIFFEKQSNLIEIIHEESPEKTPPDPLSENTNKLNQNSISMRFSRPYDLKPDERDKYIDEIYLKFRFNWKNSDEAFDKNQQKEEEKQLFLNAKFEKSVIDRLRNEMALEYLTPECIIDEIFNVQNLSKISKTFFKIKMQVYSFIFHFEK